MALPLKPKPPILSNIWPLFDGKTVIVVTHRLAAIEDLVMRLWLFRRAALLLAQFLSARLLLPLRIRPAADPWRDARKISRHRSFLSNALV
jgi:hypothetical protein